MKKNKNNVLRNGVKGFILAAIPIIILDLQGLIIVGYFSDFILKIITDSIKYGFIGVIVSLMYTYFSKLYPKTSRFAILAIIIGYYLVIAIYFIVGTYFYKMGPLFG